MKQNKAACSDGIQNNNNENKKKLRNLWTQNGALDIVGFLMELWSGLLKCLPTLQWDIIRKEGNNIRIQ